MKALGSDMWKRCIWGLGLILAALAAALPSRMKATGDPTRNGNMVLMGGIQFRNKTLDVCYCCALFQLESVLLDN